MRTPVVFSIIVLLWSCNGQDKAGTNARLISIQADTANYTTIHWIDSAHDFGKVRFGDTAIINFHFLNTGSKQLVITDVTPGCGCTVADYTREPVAPGKGGFVRALFDSHKSHPGSIFKNIRVTANTRDKQQFELVFSGQVLEESSAANK